MPSQLKVDFHTHTIDDPYEIINYSAFQLIDAACQKGFDALSITNHDTITSFKELIRYAEKNRILLIPGMEATFSKKHVLIINPDFKKNPEKRPLSDLAQIKNERNLIIAPHPFFPTPTSLKSLLFSHMHLFDAIEFSNYYNPLINFNKKAVKAAHRYKKPLIGTSDSHFFREFGKTYTLVKARKDPLSIIEAVKKGEMDLITSPLSLLSAAQMVFNINRLMTKRPSL